MTEIQVDAGIEFVSDGTAEGTKVLVNGKPMKFATSVSFSLAAENLMPKAEITVICPKLKAEGKVKKVTVEFEQLTKAGEG